MKDFGPIRNRVSDEDIANWVDGDIPEDMCEGDIEPSIDEDYLADVIAYVFSQEPNIEVDTGCIDIESIGYDKFAVAVKPYNVFQEEGVAAGEDPQGHAKFELDYEDMVSSEVEIYVPVGIRRHGFGKTLYRGVLLSGKQLNMKKIFIPEPWQQDASTALNYTTRPTEVEEGYHVVFPEDLPEEF